MPDEIIGSLKNAVIKNSLLDRPVEVLKIFNKYYCNKCYVDTGLVAELSAVRDEQDAFNCRYCAAIGRWRAEEI
jgi:ribosomal protein L40E